MKQSSSGSMTAIGALGNLYGSWREMSLLDFSTELSMRVEITHTGINPNGSIGIVLDVVAAADERVDVVKKLGHTMGRSIPEGTVPVAAVAVFVHMGGSPVNMTGQATWTISHSI